MGMIWRERVMTICIAIHNIFHCYFNVHTHTPIQKLTLAHTVCLQTSLYRNCSDIYICTWSLSASFHYLEPDLERGRLEWMVDDWNERRIKCTWKSYSESKPCSLLSDRVTYRVSVLERETPDISHKHKYSGRHMDVLCIIWMLNFIQPKD